MPCGNPDINHENVIFPFYPSNCYHLKMATTQYCQFNRNVNLADIYKYYILGEIKQSDWFLCTMWHICKQHIGFSNSILDSESVYWMVTSSTANQISPYKGPQSETIGHCDVTKKTLLCFHDDNICCRIFCFCYNFTTSIFNCDITMRKTCTVFTNQHKN